MSEMVERVAAALLAWDLNRPEGELPKTREEYWAAAMRIAIEAMREPTAAMCRAVANTCGDPEVVVVISASGAENVWRTMLNEALK